MKLLVSSKLDSKLDSKLGSKLDSKLEGNMKSPGDRQNWLPSYLTILRDLFAILAPSNDPEEKYAWANKMMAVRYSVQREREQKWKDAHGNTVDQRSGDDSATGE
jgi:hypothetical protein